MSHLIALYALALLLGGMTIFSFLFAPLVFMRLPAAAAGSFIRAVFPWYYLYVLIASGVAFIALWLADGRCLAGWAMLAVFAAGLYARQRLMPQLNQWRDAAEAGDSAAARRFDRGHRLSVGLNAAQWLVALVLLGQLAEGPRAAPPVRPAADLPCEQHSGWTSHKGRPTSWPQLAERHGDSRVWLLGEQHDLAEHHAWQLQVLSTLAAGTPKTALGMEMFPRVTQPVLDRWVAGELDWQGLLQAAEWQRVWGFDPGLYRPLLEYARVNHLRVLALNIDPETARRVSDLGWSAVPEGEREGLSDPAPPTRRYRRELEAAFAQHPPTGAGADAPSHPGAAPHGADAEHPQGTSPHGPAPHGAGATDAASAPDTASTAEAEAATERFIEVQLAWDRAMAEAIADALDAPHPPERIVAILGQGHIGHHRGVPLQLADLGVTDVVSLQPLAAGAACAGRSGINPFNADALFIQPVQAGGAEGTAGNGPAEKPRLGVSLGVDLRGARILEVQAGSLAEREGLLAGDVITELAGRPCTGATDVVEAVRRQPPGTWMPITIVRDSAVRHQVLRFPPSAAAP